MPALFRCHTATLSTPPPLCVHREVSARALDVLETPPLEVPSLAIRIVRHAALNWPIEL